MLGVQEEVEVHGLDGLGRRLFAFEHVEEVGGVTEVVTRGYGVVAVADAVMRGDDAGELRDEALRLADVGVAGVVLDVGVEGSDCGGGGAQDVHGVSVLDEPDYIEDLRGESAVLDEPRVEVGELLFGGKVAVEEEVADLFEIGVLSQVMNVVTAIEQYACFAIDKARLCGIEYDVLQASRQRSFHFREPPILIFSAKKYPGQFPGW